MDIQQLVDSRIEELKAQARAQNDLSRRYLLPGDELLAAGRTQMDPARPDIRGRRERDLEMAAGLPPYDRIFDQDDGMVVMDRAIEKVAEKVLAVTEALANDYARIENEMLNSRLAILQSAEAVLDMAVSLREKARRLLVLEAAQRRMAGDFDAGPAGTGHYMGEADDPHLDGGRASMHRHGVAALFQRTQQ